MPDPAAVVLAVDLKDIDWELIATGDHVATAGQSKMYSTFNRPA